MNILTSELAPEQLRKTIDPGSLGLETTEHLPTLAGVIGQDRATAALELGIGLKDEGFNIYVSGSAGIGKMTAVKAYLEKIAATKDTPPDWCYVYNFDDPYLPKAILLPPGRGRMLQQDMRNLLDHIRRELPKAFESEEYNAKREAILKKLEVERAKLVKNFTEKARASGFLVQLTPMGIELVPLVNNESLTEQQVQQLSESDRQDIEQRRAKVQEELALATKELRQLERDIQQEIQENDRQLILYVVGEFVKEVEEEFKDVPEVVQYLQDIEKAIVENLDLFRNAPVPKTGSPAMGTLLVDKELPFRKFQVNVLVDHSKQSGAPVLVEQNATYNNLFGRIEKETLLGALHTDFTLIKPGSLHIANGGYLVLQIEDLLRNPFSWDGLKRMLRSKQIDIEDVADRYGFYATKGVRPQAIPLDIKIILTGPPLLRYLLLAYDPDFPELFKVKADFDTRMEIDPQNMQAFISFLCTFCNKEKVRHLDASGVAEVMEYAMRLAEDQRWLSTRFGQLADLIREANYWASQEGVDRINESHIEKALERKVYRSNLVQERIQEMMIRGSLLIATDGQNIGQVNGLSFIDLKDYYFGRASRISASVGPGRGGIIDIEREVELGGPIHSKGVLILSGYLTQRYAQDKPLSLSARIGFEQSYSEIEGDSASSAELYALLSALSGVPIFQGIAVTGSVNQHGELQAIGGVNEKVEGFFDLCKARGLTSHQGVIIPESNSQNLMLRKDVVEAVRTKQFHLWAVTNIDQGMEILTGMAAGERLCTGQFPPGTINYLVDQRLLEFAICLKRLDVSQEKRTA